MSLILNIDSSLETASVSIAENGLLLKQITNTVQKAHAVFLHTAIKDSLKSLSLELKSMDAIAVTKGPGSYTGLRVGMASAKGLCYALNKPLITIGTLNLIAKASIASHNRGSESLYCPVIDARRMEVYTALFDHEMNEILPPSALILDDASFNQILDSYRVSFAGSGSSKLAIILLHKNAFFTTPENIPASLSFLAHEYFHDRKFTELADSEPLYVKEFYSSLDFKNKSLNLSNKK